MCNISKILTGEKEKVGLDLPEDFANRDMMYFMLAPLTLSDVERSFSFYKTMLAPNIRSSKFEI